MKTLLITLFSLTILSANGQITNSTSKSESNIYFHAVDTLISLVLAKETPPKIVIVSDDYVLNRLPDSFYNQMIYKKEKLKGTAKFENAIWIIIDRLDIGSGKVVINSSIRKQTNRQMLSWDSNISNYGLIYEYEAEKGFYKLIDIKKGIYIR